MVAKLLRPIRDRFDVVHNMGEPVELDLDEHGEPKIWMELGTHRILLRGHYANGTPENFLPQDVSND